MKMENMMPDYPEKPHVLIDADILAYSIPFKFMQEAEEDICLHTLDKKIREIIKETEATTYQLYLTGEGNFREDIAITAVYKGGRTKDKPTHYKSSRNFMVKCWGAVVVDGIEADDAITIFATQNKDCVIASIDKDLKQVGGWHYRWSVGERKASMEYIPQLGYLRLNEERKLEFGGDKGLYAQMIIGDRVDNIIGLKGKGDVFAYEALKDCENEKELKGKVFELYKEEFGEDYLFRFSENFQLLYMLRAEGKTALDALTTEIEVEPLSEDERERINREWGRLLYE